MARQYLAEKPSLGTIDILNGEIEEVHDHHSKSHVFRLIVQRGATFLFEPECREEYDEWLDSMRVATRGGVDLDPRVGNSKATMFRPSRPVVECVFLVFFVCVFSSKS